MSPKSNRVGLAYQAAMADVLKHGSLPVPKHLRSASGRQRRDMGDGHGYLLPHDFEGGDVEQQYLPDELVGRRYYVPSDQGAEKRIGEFMEERRATRKMGKPRRRDQPSGGASMSDGLEAHNEARKRLSETQKKDAQ